MKDKYRFDQNVQDIYEELKEKQHFLSLLVVNWVQLLPM